MVDVRAKGIGFSVRRWRQLLEPLSNSATAESGAEAVLTLKILSGVNLVEDTSVEISSIQSRW